MTSGSILLTCKVPERDNKKLKKTMRQRYIYVGHPYIHLSLSTMLSKMKVSCFSNLKDDDAIDRNTKKEKRKKSFRLYRYLKLETDLTNILIPISYFPQGLFLPHGSF